MLGRLVEAWCLERGVDITPYGSWTHESKEGARGAEPDECYVLGDDPAPLRCDLAIEVVWSHGGIDKLQIYQKLGVREVWVWRRAASRSIACEISATKRWPPAKCCLASTCRSCSDS